MTTSTSYAPHAVAFAFLSILGCDPDPGTEPAVSGDGPVYLAATRVFSPDGMDVTSYFHLLPSLEAGTSVDPALAIEVAGAAKLYSIEDVGWFAIGDGEAPVLTRYELDSDGRLVEGDQLSLLGEGVGYLWDTLYVVSPTKVYYPDRDGQQLIIINPTAMTIEGTIPLPETAREGFLALYGYGAIVMAGRLVFPVGWFDWTNDVVLGETGLVVIDTDTDSVSRVDVDERCGGVTTPVTLASGDTLFVSSALAGAAHALGRLDTAPCALRVRAGEDAFDADYAVLLADITDGALAGEPVPAGGDELFLRVFDDSLGTVQDGAASWEITGQSAWTWLRWNVVTGEVGSVPELPASTADVLWFEVEDTVYGTQTTADYSETTLIDLTSGAAPTFELVAPGFLHNAARIR